MSRQRGFLLATILFLVSFNLTANDFLPKPSISTNGSTTICQGQTRVLSTANDPAYSYQWLRDSVSIPGATGFSYPATEAGSYRVVVSIDTLSNVSDGMRITVNPLPIVSVSNDTTVCSGDTVVLTASGGIGYSWSFGGPNAPEFTLAPTFSKTYTVTVTNSYGCSDQANVTVNVISLPNAWISASNSTTLCEGQTVTLNTANTAGYSHQWQKDGVNIPGANSSSYVVNEAGSYKVAVTANGCHNTSTPINVSVNPLPWINVSNDTTVCAGSPVMLNASGNGTFKWSEGGATGSTIQVSPSFTRTYSVTVTSSDGCTVSDAVTVNVIQLPLASVNPSAPASLCEGQSVTFYSSNGAGYWHQWKKDGANIPGANSYNYTANTSGNYHVLIVANGCKRSSDPIAVTVNPLPNITVSNDTTICAGNSVTLTVSGQGSFEWSEGGATGSSIVVTPSATKTYSVTATSSQGCTRSASMTVNVTPLPSDQVTTSGSTNLCLGESITFNASTGSGYTYQWKKNWIDIPGATSSSYTTSGQGQYRVITTANGCSNSSSPFDVKVNPLPGLTVSNDKTLCEGESTTLYASGSGSFLWSNGNPTNSITVTPQTTTTYSVTITSGHNCTVSDDITVTVIPLQPNNVGTSGSTTLCSGNTVTLSATEGLEINYQWYNGASPISGANSSSYTTGNPGNYSVMLTASGCTNTSNPVPVVVNPLPVITVSNDTTVCPGDAVALTASGGASYIWSAGGAHDAVNVITPTITRTYTVTATTDKGCSAQENVTVTVNPRPQAWLSTSGSTTLCEGQTVTFTTANTAGYQHQWKKNGIDIPGANSNKLVANETGTYQVGVTANGCYNASILIDVVVNPLPWITVSNDTTVCAGSPVTLHASGNGSFTWSEGGVTGSILQIAPTHTRTYSVTVSSSDNCTVSDAVTVNVTQLPLASVNPSSPATLCQGESVTFYSSNGSGYFHQWKKDGIDIPGANSYNYKATVTGNYHVFTTANGCHRSSNPIQVTVNPLPIITVNNDTTICAGNSVNLSVSGQGSFVWSEGGATGSSILVTPAATKTYSVTATSTENCTNSKSVEVNVTQLPAANITASGSTILCQGETITFNTSTGSGYTYQWMKNGDSIPGANNSSYTASVAGDYFVITSANGCSKTSDHITVVVNPRPNLSVSNDTTVCEGDTVTLVATGNGNLLWSNGVASSSITLTAQTTKTYSVTVTSGDNCAVSKEINVSVIPLQPNSVTTSGSTTLCSGNSVTLFAGTGASIDYQWYDSANPIPGANSSSYTTGDAGIYSVVLSANGCVNTSHPIPVVVNPLPVITITNDTTVCPGDIVPLQASGGASYIWSAGGAQDALNIITPTITRTYTVTVTTAEGCSGQKSVTVHVNPTPQAWVSTSGSTTLCDGKTVTLITSSTAGYSYQWNKDSIDIPGANSNNLVVNETGIYQVSVTANECSNLSTQVPVVVNPLPLAITPSDITVCSGDTALLTAAGGTSYQWSNGGPADSNFTIIPTLSKTYTVTVSNQYGCSAIGSTLVSVIPLPQTWLSTSGSTTLCQGQAVAINTVSNAGYGYQWKKNGNNIPGANSNSIVANETGDYSVRTTSNGCYKESALMPVTINPLPVATTSNDTTVCSGKPVALSASGGVSYKWTGGITDSLYTVSTTSSKTYHVTVTNSYSCTSTGDVTISIIPLPNASLTTSGSTTFCQGGNVTLFARTDSGYAYQWQKGNLDLTGATTASYYANESGNYQVKVTANGCSKASVLMPITVNPLPVISITNDTTICSLDTVNLVASGGINYSWNTDYSGPFYEVTPASTTTYTVTVTDHNGCSDFKEVTLSTIPLPPAVVSASGPTSVCIGESVNLNTTSGQGYTYQWKRGSNIINGAVNPSYSASISGDYHVVTKANGCTNQSEPIQIAVNSKPELRLNNDTIICSGKSLNLTATGGGNYVWSNGSISSSIYVTPPSSANYSVTVSSNEGCSVTDNVLVTVIPSPVASINAANPTSICAGETITLTTPVGAGYIYQWKKDGNNISGGNSPSFTTSEDGVYSVAVSALGCHSTSSPVQVNVNTLPVVTINSDTTICSGNQVSLEATGGSIYKWSNGYWGSINNITPNATKTYSVTVTNAANCTANDSVTVNVNPTPNASVTTSNTTNICQGDSVRLSVNNNSGTSYQWFKDATPLASAKSHSYTAKSSGDYTVVVDNSICSKTSNIVPIVVNPVPTAMLTPDTAICTGESATLTANGGTHYLWNTGSQNQSITVFPFSNKTYSVTVTYGGACADVKDVTVSVNPVPNAFFTASTLNLCKGESVQLNANSGNGYTYKWFKNSFSIPGADSISYTVDAGGSYSVEVSKNGCSRTSTPKVITVHAIPFVRVNEDTTICQEESVTLIATGGVKYRWNTWSTDSIYIVTPNTSNTYIVTGTDINGCENTDTVHVEVIPLPTGVYISTSSSTTICEGNSVRLSVNSSNGTHYQWLKDQAVIPGAIETFFEATESGNYTVSVSANGCSKTALTTSVNVLPLPQIPHIIRIGEDSLRCSVPGINYKWFKDGIAVAIGSRTIKASKKGYYTVQVTDEKCNSELSEPYHFFFTGLPSYDSGNSIAVYPNPNNGIFTVELSKRPTDWVEIRLLNAIGKEINSFEKTRDQHIVPIKTTGLEAGIYFVEITCGTYRWVEKVLINH